MSGVSSLSLAELRVVHDHVDHWTKYVTFERQGAWLIFEVHRDDPPRCMVWSRHEDTGDVIVGDGVA